MKAGMCAARLPRDRPRLRKTWQADRRDGNFASSAWPCQLLARQQRQPGTVTAPPSKRHERKPWNGDRQACWLGTCNTTFELSGRRRRVAVDSKRKMGRRPSA